jgi:hypothetical protein
VIDPRANSKGPLAAPAPLPHVSRRALGRIDDALPIPTECRYCAGPVALVDNSEIYRGRSYGGWPFAYWCKDCDAMVGLHPDTDLPLGTLADKALRTARQQCKAPFERIWRVLRLKSRKGAYAWLAEQLGIPVAECHFGLFEVEQCERARDASMRFLQAQEKAHVA